jgi:LPXTG-motif cell wall-anchored protein
MKHVRHALAFVMTLVMALAIAAPAFAEDAATPAAETATTGTITIKNAAKGETYKIYKLFDATYDKNHPDRINYRGTIPEDLTDYFKADTAGNITAKEGALIKSDAEGEAKLTDAARNALKAWAATQTATGEKVGDGTKVVFDKLAFGYYVVTTTQDAGNYITINTTNPEATIIDKNTTAPVKDPAKSIDDANVYIGQTVEYKVTFGTATYYGTRKITKYTIGDDFAKGALDRASVNVKSIVVDEDGKADTTDDQHTVTKQFGDDDKIVLDWVGEDGKSLYKNGATITITYTATVAKAAAIAGKGNTNTASISFTSIKESEPGEEPDPDPDPEPQTASTTFKTYAFVLQKTNRDREFLAGATFRLPFYVYEDADTNDGAYVYAGTEAGKGLTNQLTTDSNGRFIVKGLEGNTEVSLTEVEAPAGYNKLSAPVKVTPAEITATNTKYFYDDTGELVNAESSTTTTVTIDKIAATPIVVLNNAGAEMPSTGGIGTTIFYVVGGVMVAGAVIMLLTKRRVAGSEE